MVNTLYSPPDAITLKDMIDGAKFKNDEDTLQLHEMQDGRVIMSVIENAPYPNYPNSPIGTKQHYVEALNKWGYHKCTD